MRWLMEGGGDGHDIHLQVPVVLKSIFHVQNEDSLKTCWVFLEFWFQGPPHQVVSPTLPPTYTFPPFPCVPKCMDLFLFQPQFLDLHLATESCWEQRAGGEATEGGGGWGGSSATPVLCCRLGPTWTEDANTPWGTGKGWGQQNLGMISLPLGLRKLFLVPSHPHLILLCLDGVNKRKILVLSDSSNSCLPQLEKTGL